MTDERIQSRAENLLPEELTADPADPEAMAAAILTESDERQKQAESDQGQQETIERRTSEEASL